MIRYVHGNLLETTDSIIAHGCNALGVMGAGVALAIRNRYPGCFKKYRAQYTNYGLVIGEVVWYHDSTISIANCITQENVGDGLQVDYNAIRDTAHRVLSYAKKSNMKSVSYPKIGAGLAGGDWRVIASILEDESNCAEVDINVYIMEKEEYNKTIGRI